MRKLFLFLFLAAAVLAEIVSLGRSPGCSFVMHATLCPAGDQPNYWQLFDSNGVSKPWPIYAYDTAIADGDQIRLNYLCTTCASSKSYVCVVATGYDLTGGVHTATGSMPANCYQASWRVSYSCSNAVFSIGPAYNTYSCNPE